MTLSFVTEVLFNSKKLLLPALSVRLPRMASWPTEAPGESTPVFVTFPLIVPFPTSKALGAMKRLVTVRLPPASVRVLLDVEGNKPTKKLRANTVAPFEITNWFELPRLPRKKSEEQVHLELASAT